MDYRLLREGEVIKEGDDYYWDHKWTRSLGMWFNYWTTWQSNSLSSPNPVSLDSDDRKASDQSRRNPRWLCYLARSPIRHERRSLRFVNGLCFLDAYTSAAEGLTSEFWLNLESQDGYRRCQFKGIPKGPWFTSDIEDMSSRCMQTATDLHHKKGRADSNLTNKSTFMGLCRFHHNWIHDHAREARKRKYLLT